MTKYKYANAENTAVDDLERGEYGIRPGVSTWRDVLAWVQQGNVIEPYRTDEERVDADARNAALQKTLDDIQYVRSYPKLQAITKMTPAEVGVWVDANVTTLAAAKDAIKTLAMAICILAKRI